MYRKPNNSFSHINDTETFAERQARVKAQTQKDTERAEKKEAIRHALVRARQAQARADFDALGKVMATTTDREKLVEIGRKRKDLVPDTGISHHYENHCWHCPSPISSTIHARCKDCGWYICSECGSCSPNCPQTYYPVNVEDVDPFLNMPDDLIF